MELVHITNPDFETMSKIVKIEKEAFEGSGNVDLWIIKALIRYGFVFVVKNKTKLDSKNKLNFELFKKDLRFLISKIW